MKFFSKFTSKVWTGIILKNGFDLREISKESNLLELPAPNDHSISADPSFLDSENILFESISNKNGCGQIFHYNLRTKNLYRLGLKVNFHYSFPLTYDFHGKNYISLESNEGKGIILYRFSYGENNRISELNKVVIKSNINFRVIDPVLIKLKERIYCFGSSYNQPNISYCLGELSMQSDLKGNLISQDIFKVKIPGRLGGRFIIKGKDIIAITQTSTRKYGDGIKIYNLRKGDKLKNTHTITYKMKNHYGPHTLNYSPCNNYIAIDMCRESLHPKDMIVKIKQYLVNKRG